MAHPRVEQLRFTRGEFRRALKGISDDDARRRLLPINSISWMIGHLTYHEYIYWVKRTQEQHPQTRFVTQFRWGKPASTPPLDEVWSAWHAITQAADAFLDTLTTEMLQTKPLINEKPFSHSYGSMLQRLTYHYWYHIGESQAVRQLLGHAQLPQFVGSIEVEAPYEPERALPVEDV
jgi:hypothetical protein